MDKALVADKLTAKYGVKVYVGNLQTIEDIKDEEGKVINQIVHRKEDHFYRADGVDVSAADVTEATATVLAELPTGEAKKDKVDSERFKDIEDRLAALEKK